MTPPQDLEAEASVLGAMMSSAEAAATAVESLKPTDFSNEGYALIYGAAFALFNAGKPVDAVTVSSELERNGILDDVGGSAFLRSMVSGVPSLDHVAEYVQAVKDTSTARKVLQVSYDVQEMVRQGKASPDDLLSKVENSLIRIGEEANRADFRHLRNIIFDRYGSDEPMESGISTGYENIDKVIGGFVPGRIYVLAARPGVGKTTLAINMAQKVSLQQCGAVLMYSLEMSGEELSDRIIASTAGVVSDSMKAGKLSPEEFYRFIRACGLMETADMHIDDDATLTFHAMRAKARRFAASHKIALIIIDYLQLLSFDGGKTENRQQEIATISRNLKKMAMELEVPIIVVSQLNREPEQRKNRKPELSDLRDSGAIEQDADVACFLWFDPEEESQTICELLIKKNRHGPQGVADLIFTPEFTRFRDYQKARIID